MKIHHVGYLTKKMDKAIKAFTDLGYTIEKETKYDEIREINIAFLINGDYRVELIEPVSKESPMYPLLKNYKNTPYHFCYITDDIEASISKLNDMGYMVIHKPEIAPCIDDNRVSFLINPSMGIIELVEMV